MLEQSELLKMFHTPFEHSVIWQVHILTVHGEQFIEAKEIAGREISVSKIKINILFFILSPNNLSSESHLILSKRLG